LPGFIDTHVHVEGISPREIAIEQAKSIADIQRLIREKAKQLGPGEWITGGGWSEYELAEQRRPLRADLDSAAPDNPVALWRAGQHSAVGNSAALKLANITSATPDPEHGVIERDEKGEPNGVIRERTDIFRKPERAKALIGIAHPDFREGLEHQAYEHRLIPRGVSFEASTSTGDKG
jgi:predicted amidohydrolase YtcJ